MRLLGTLGLIAAVAAATAQPPRARPGTLRVGDPAPAFELGDTTGKKTVKLADLKGKPVVLVFGSCT